MRSQKMISALVLGTGLMALAVACKPRGYNAADVKDSWNNGGENNPALFEQHYGKLEVNFDKLKTLAKGNLTNIPWSDTFWPNSEGGITVRWQENKATERYKYKSPFSSQQIDEMAKTDPAALSRLSPAEKYDIVTGGYRNGWPMWQREASLTTSCPAGLGVTHGSLERVVPQGPRSTDWEGKCHAWVPASLHFPEPGIATVDATTTDGQPFKVQFGSSDIKALLIVGYDMFLHQYPDYARVGSRCERNYKNLGAGSASPCLDTNAGAFFVLATNLIQPGKPGFVIDRDPGTQVWNQPVYAYQHVIEEGKCPIEIKNPARKNQRVAHVQTALAWVGELQPAVQPFGEQSRIEVDKYEYCLEIDEKNNVVGGAWVSKMRPDFIWMTNKPNFEAQVTDTQTGKKFDFTKVMRIYEQSRQGMPASTQ